MDLRTLHVLSLHRAYAADVLLMNYSSLEFELLLIFYPPLFGSEAHR